MMSLTSVRNTIENSIRLSNREENDVKLIAVSKTQPTDKIEKALLDGQRIFGENRVQEAAEKWPALKASFPNTELHLIGPLQSNKARQAVELFDVIQTLDRLKLAKAIARIAGEVGTCPRLYAQVNTGEEDQKAGIIPSEADAFIAECRALGLHIEGLMCIPPAQEEPSLHFALLKKIAYRNDIRELSMGMSADFETAIGQGATYIRVGSAIFGGRNAV